MRKWRAKICMAGYCTLNLRIEEKNQLLHILIAFQRRSFVDGEAMTQLICDKEHALTVLKELYHALYPVFTRTRHTVRVAMFYAYIGICIYYTCIIILYTCRRPIVFHY